MSESVGPPGWYPDPGGSDGRRSWDGSAWSGTSSAGSNGLIRWWSGSSTVIRTVVVVTLIGFVVCVVSLMIPSEKDRQIDDCINQLTTTGKYPLDQSVAKRQCHLMYELSEN